MIKVNKVKLGVLVLVIFLSAFLRFYKLSQAPPSLSWDETAVGYNAWTVLNWGKDEWGKTLPLSFKSFEDDKHPVHIYLTVPTVAIFGLNEMGVRASSALFGVLNVIIIFFLAKKIFGNNLAGLIASFVLSISPYSIHFSRFNHELNFALFFFMSGLYFLLKGIEKKNWLIILGFAGLGLDLLTYHSAKVVVPPIILLIIILYFKDLMKIKKYFLGGILVFSFFVSLLFIEPALLGGARLKQTSSPQERTIQAVTKKYLTHFSYNFLFVKGDVNPRLSGQTGTFYKVDIAFLTIGLLALVWGIIKGKKEYLIVLAWALLAPIPAAITSEAPHAARAMFMTGSWHLILTLGVYTIINTFKNRYVKIIIGFVIFGAFAISLFRYLQGYFDDYTKRYAIEWQYGMKQIVEYVKAHPEYDEVYMTAERQEPYIFYLFYFKTPLPLYLKTVKYNQTLSRPANTVAAYSKFHFGLWDPIESQPNAHVLYVVTPSDYNGLRYKLLFDTVYAVKYPNGSDAFFLVTAKSTFE
ncbi:MAG: glycosyltransferase family 39 protein [Candidatus Woesebacteria bacterium]|nr:glycosyltransferase family 39 protein [Candidatus Woesebacteria bacterium]